MKTKLIRTTDLIKATLFLCMFIATNFLHAQDENNKQIAVNVLSYNIHNAIGIDGNRHCQDIGDLIRQYKADVVAIQEIDSCTNRSKKLNILDEISHEALYFGTFAKAINFEGGSYGIGILSKTRPLSVKRIPLPGKEEKRVLLIAEFDKFYFANVHLSLTEKDRLTSLDIINQEAKKLSKPLLLAGDFNDTPDSKVIKIFKQTFQILSNTKEPSYPSISPKDCIDYIAVYKGETKSPAISKYRTTIKEDKLSDHRPIYTETVIMTPANKIFRAEPYLQNPVNNGISILFQTNVISHCWIEYGTDTLHLNKTRTLLDGQEVCDDISNCIRLKKLKQDVTYYYRVCAQEILNNQSYHKDFGHIAKTPFYNFTIPNENTSNFTAIIFNDLHNQTNVQYKLLEYIKNIKYDFVIFNGDCLPNPSTRNNTINDLHRLFDPVDAKNHPIIFIRGNHEIRNAYSSAMHHLLDYTNDNTYCGFNWGDTRFVILDCGEDKPDDSWVYYGLNDFSKFRNDQVGFLKEELSSKAFKKAKRRILMDHIPLFGEGKNKECSKLWLPLLQKAPFDLYLAAHIHQFKVMPADSINTPYPLVIGGGPSMKSGVVMILQKKGKDLTLKCINTKGETTRLLKL